MCRLGGWLELGQGVVSQRSAWSVLPIIVNRRTRPHRLLQYGWGGTTGSKIAQGGQRGRRWWAEPATARPLRPPVALEQ